MQVTEQETPFQVATETRYSFLHCLVSYSSSAMPKLLYSYSIYITIYLSTYLCIYISLYINIYISLSIYLYILYIYVFIYISIYLSATSQQAASLGLRCPTGSCRGCHKEFYFYSGSSSTRSPLLHRLLQAATRNVTYIQAATAPGLRCSTGYCRLPQGM
jgi:hypothetical protein